MPDTPPLDQRGAAFAMAVLSTVAKTADAMLKDGRTTAARDYFRPGDRLSVPDPETGQALGKVWMTDPDPQATISNRAAFTAWQAEEDPAAVEEVAAIASGRHADALAVLEEHAPHLLTVETRVRDWAEAAALKAAVEPDADPIPGVDVRTPRGTMSVKLDDAGADRIRELVASGSVDPLRALPAAKDGAP